MKTQTMLFFLALAVSPCAAARADLFDDVATSADVSVDETSQRVFAARLHPDRVWRGDSSLVPLHAERGAEPILLMRGQTPTFDDGTGTSPYYDGSIYSPDPNAQYGSPMSPMMGDPFMNPQYLQQQQPQVFPGVNGPQPYRYGWTLRTEFEYLSGEPVSGPTAGGDLSIWGVNIEAQNASPMMGGGVFVHTPEFWYRGLEGPAFVTAGGNGLPASLYHFGWDLKWQTPSVAGWGAEFVFEPSLNTDFSSLGSNAWNLDGRGALLWQWAPNFTVIGGVMYWDRVHDRVLPYGGVVWQPDQLWEFRIMYPESQVKLFLGNYMGHAKWLYARVEYHSEAYQVELDGGLGPIDSQIQMDDWRATIGLQSDNGYSASFIEAGWVFDRETHVRGFSSFNVGSGFMARAGLRF